MARKQKMSFAQKLYRVGAFGIGITATALGAYGAFEYQLSLEGRMTYLVLAAPFVAAAAALIPVFVELAWQHGARLKAFIWLLILFPAAATVFLAVSERMHHAKAGAVAERSAVHASVTRLKAELQREQAIRDETIREARKVMSWRKCKASCQEKQRGLIEIADRRVQAAEQSLRGTQSKATTEAELQAPVWLLPATLDLVAFIAIWTALAPSHGRHWPEGSKVTKAPAKRRKPTVRKPRKPRTIANDNVLSLR